MVEKYKALHPYAIQQAIIVVDIVAISLLGNSQRTMKNMGCRNHGLLLLFRHIRFFEKKSFFEYFYNFLLSNKESRIIDLNFNTLKVNFFHF